MWLNDLRYAARALRKAPAFTGAAILTLTLGIGANTAIFSVVNAELLRALPFAEPERLMHIAEKNEKLHLVNFNASVLNYLSWKEQAQSFESLGAIAGSNFNLTGRGEPEQFAGSAISPSLMPLLGLQPVIGRTFREGEDRPGSPPVALLSEGLWKRRFGSDPALIGRTLTLNGIDYTVLGIAPQALAVLTSGDIWMPLLIDPGRENRLNHVINVVGRLKHGVTFQQAQAEMDTVATRVRRQYPEIREWGIQLTRFEDWFISNELRTTLLVLLGAVAFVLLIACANVANLLLSRAASRQREMAVRTAIGATRGHLLRHFLTESLLLSSIGGAAGLAIATFAVRVMRAMLPDNLLPLSDISIDSRVLLFAVSITLLTGLLFGLAPAWHGLKTDLNTVLKQGGRSAVGAGRPLLRNALVGGELALATVLLIGAGLLIQTLLHLQQAPLGFRPQGLLTFQLSPSATKYPDAARSWAFYKRLLELLETIPGVRRAAISSGIPLGAGSYNTTPAAPVGESVLPPGTALPIDWRIVSPDYFSTLGVPLLRGRIFTERDGPAALPSMIVSKETARKFWGAVDPLGRIVRIVGSGKQFTVVGMVGDVRNNALNQAPNATMYFSSVMRLWPVMDIVVRTDGKPEAVESAVRRKVHEIDRDVPPTNVRTMEQWVSNNAAQPRLNASLLAGFAFVALVIAAVGVYGVLSYSVNQRAREIGLRIALGAQQRNVLSMVVREGMAVGFGGIGLGLACALAMSRVLASLVYDVQVRDFATFAAAACVLAAVALAACYVPARRAACVDPIIALRDE